MIRLSAYAAVIVLGLLFCLRWAKQRLKRARPCRQCAARTPRGWPSDLCLTCLRVRDELRLLDTGWPGPSSLLWLVRRQGEELGPYDLAALRTLGGRGKLAAFDRVWTEGMGTWRRADLIEGLLPGGSGRSAARHSNLFLANWFLAHWRAVLVTAAILIAMAAGVWLARAGLHELALRQAGPTELHAINHGTTEHGTTEHGTTEHGTTEHGPTEHGPTDVVDENEHTQNDFNAARSALEADFLGVPVFAVLQRLEPAMFTNLRETYVSGVLSGAPRNEMSAKVRATMMEKVIPKYARIAPDHELIAYWRTQIEKAQELRAIDPRYCAEFLAPPAGTDTRELVSFFSPEAKRADIRALADLMVAGSQHPQNVPQGKAVQGALRESARRAEQRVPGALQIVANPGMATTRPSQFCHAEVAFYESILALPTDRAGPLLRYLVARG